MRTYVNVALFKNGKKENSFTDEIENISADIFDGSTAGEQYLLTFVEMDEKEFNNLPEFVGF